LLQSEDDEAALELGEDVALALEEGDEEGGSEGAAGGRVRTLSVLWWQADSDRLVFLPGSRPIPLTATKKTLTPTTTTMTTTTTTKKKKGATEKKGATTSDGRRTRRSAKR
jgi:hypothetical protein